MLEVIFCDIDGASPESRFSVDRAGRNPYISRKNALAISCNVQGGFKIATTILLLFPRLYICILCISAPSASVSIGQRHDSAKCNIREVLSAEKHTTIL